MAHNTTRFNPIKMTGKSIADRPITDPELACVYAALILLDDDIPITGDKISTILKAANVDVERFWPGLFAKALDGQDVKGMLTNLGAPGGGGGAAVAGAGPAAAAGPAAEAAKPEEKKKEATPEEESDEDMGFGLFD